MLSLEILFMENQISSAWGMFLSTWQQTGLTNDVKFSTSLTNDGKFSTSLTNYGKYVISSKNDGKFSQAV
jgi:hypothetical protein